MRAKHFMTFNEICDRRNEESLDKIVSSLNNENSNSTWNKSKRIIKTGFRIAGVAFIIMIHIAEYLCDKIDNFRYRKANNSMTNEYMESDEDDKPSYFDLAIPGHSEYNREVDRLLQHADVDGAEDRIRELANKSDYEKESYLHDHMYDMY